MYKKKTRHFFIRTAILILLLFTLIGYAFRQNLKGNEELEIGDKAPDFQLESLTGERVKLSDLKGKVVLINFWATWCPPCKKEMPAIQSVYNEFHDDGFVVLAVNLAESEYIISQFKKKTDIEFPIYLDKDESVKSMYGVYYIPSSFFIDRQGKIARMYEGEMKIENLKEWIESLL